MIRFLRRVVVTLALSLGLLAINSQSTLGRVVDRYHYAPASSTTNVTTPAPNNDNTTSASLNQVNFPPPYAGAHFSSPRSCS